MVFLGNEERHGGTREERLLGEIMVGGRGEEVKGERKGERGWPRGAEQIGRRDLGAKVPEEGSVKELESGCKELGETERKWRKELERGCWGNLWNVGVGMASETPLLCRGDKQPQEGQWLPRTTWKQRRWRVLQGSDGRWWGDRVEEPKNGQAVKRKEEGQRTDRRGGRRPAVMAEPHLGAPQMWGEATGWASAGTPCLARGRGQLGRPL